MPDLLEESIAEIKEQTAHVADTGGFSGSAVADETQAEPVIECHECTAESSDKLEAPVSSDSISEIAMVDESVAVLEEPVAVLEEPAVPEETVAVLDEPIAVPDEPVVVLEESIAVLDEPVAVLDEPIAVPDEPIVVLEESIAVLDEPVAVLDEPVAVLDEPVDILDEPAAEILEETVAVLDEPAAVVPEETGAWHDEAGDEHTPFECTSEAPERADEQIELPAIEEPAAVLAESVAEAADQCSVEEAAETLVVADQVTETHDQPAPLDEADALA